MRSTSSNVVLRLVLEPYDVKKKMFLTKDKNFIIIVYEMDSLAIEYLYILGNTS